MAAPATGDNAAASPTVGSIHIAASVRLVLDVLWPLVLPLTPILTPWTKKTRNGRDYSAVSVPASFRVAAVSPTVASVPFVVVSVLLVLFLEVPWVPWLAPSVVPVSLLPLAAKWSFAELFANKFFS